MQRFTFTRTFITAAAASGAFSIATPASVTSAPVFAAAPVASSQFGSSLPTFLQLELFATTMTNP